jgi:SAM-dependent methyltransferase
MPAPADSETLLTATYGDGWRVPDPSFRYTTPRWLSRRLGGWFGGLMTFRKHWDSFDSKQRHRVPRQPSPFAQWVAQEFPSKRPLVDIGTGTGRDARWFARRHRRQVLGLDYCFSAVTRGNRHSAGRRLPATYELLNLYDARAVLALGARLSRAEEPPDLYARFVLHALERGGQENVIRLASMSLRRGGLLFLEFRTPRDRWRSHTFGEHPRRYLERADVAALVEDRGGRVLHQVEGTGLAPFNHDSATEDPVVCRMVASWS